MKGRKLSLRVQAGEILAVSCVREVLDSPGTLTQKASRLGIHERTLRRWRDKYLAREAVNVTGLAV
jgi:Transposase